MTLGERKKLKQYLQVKQITPRKVKCHQKENNSQTTRKPEILTKIYE